MKNEEELGVEFIENASPSEFDDIINSPRMVSYLNEIETKLELSKDKFEKLSDKNDNLNFRIGKLTAEKCGVNNELECAIKNNELIISRSFGVPESVADEDKILILKTAFDKYTLDQLMEKLEITWSEVF